MPSVAVTGRVTVTARANVRSGAPNRTAPVLRKLDPGVTTPVYGLVVGEAVEGNAHWYQLEGGAYLWAGACGPLQPPAPPPAAPAESPFKGYGLDPEFAGKLAELFAACRQQGHEFRISQGLRTPQTQALYYCQWAKRKPADIDDQVAKLKAAGATWTAELMHSLRDTPRKPDWQTNAMPGAGWHQWGEAADCYCYRDGHLVGSGDDPAYKAYADTAQQMGLTAGFYFSKRDSGHVQLRPDGGATSIYAWSYIDGVMRERFGEKPAVT